jgi:hypothetical protein
MDNKAQYALEYILIMGFVSLIVFSFFPYVYDINELNTCMAAARNGALLGSGLDSFAIYPDDKFEYYMENHQRLKIGSKVVFVRLEYKKEEFDPIYKRTKIKLKIYASAPGVKNPKDRDCIGDRINYYARKSICEAFKKEHLTNIYYNPAFSDRYYITTSEVGWV